MLQAVDLRPLPVFALSAHMLLDCASFPSSNLPRPHLYTCSYRSLAPPPLLWKGEGGRGGVPERRWVRSSLLPLRGREGGRPSMRARARLCKKGEIALIAQNWLNEITTTAGQMPSWLLPLRSSSPRLTERVRARRLQQLEELCRAM